MEAWLVLMHRVQYHLVVKRMEERPQSYEHGEFVNTSFA